MKTTFFVEIIMGSLVLILKNGISTSCLILVVCSMRVHGGDDLFFVERYIGYTRDPIILSTKKVVFTFWRHQPPALDLVSGGRVAAEQLVLLR